MHNNFFKKDIFLSILSGILFSLAWPTFGFPFFLFFAFVPLLLLEQSFIDNPKKKYFYLKVYTAFFIWNLLKTWWIYNSTPFGGVFAIVVNSLLMTTVFWLYHLVRKRLPQSMSIAFFISIWISFEKFHLNWDFSWPWLNLGNGFSEYPKWIQWYEYTGTFGGTFWVLIVNVLLFRLLYNNFDRKIQFYIKIFGLILWIFAPILFSFYLYKNYKETGESARVELLQPNLDPWKEKFKYNNRELTNDLLSLSDTNADLIVAPETAISNYIEINNFSTSVSYRLIKKFIEKNKDISIVTGVDFIHWYHQGDSIPDTANKTKNGHWYDMYNSAVLVNSNTGFKVYHKSKLVVGAEYTPYSKILKPLIGDFMIDLGTSMGSNVTQNERTVFKIKNMHFAPIICYESIYGEFVTGYVKKGANLLGVITNDGWWGNTEGHRQHFSLARLRAIENRRDLVHTANTGISGYINQRGDVVKILGYNKRGTVIANVYLNNSKTFYSKHGDFIARIAIFMSILLFLYAFLRKKVRFF